ncbi:hypothetical protein RHO12_03950 [Orbus sturtevantii]|uniref:penicillin-binding protein activator LpoB n=1 Tax=Orbus sturtevantii TaxID=3074109 RepID=UPI00370DA3BA
MKCFLQTVIMIVATTILAGCHLLNSNNQPALIEQEVLIVESPPKLLTTDWSIILSPLIDELLETMAVNGNNTLLISDVNNHSQQYISSTAINDILVKALNEQTIFQVIDSNSVNIAKQSVGIPNDDSLVSRGKMIALARKVNADYVLFTIIDQAPKLPDTLAEVSLELILTKTGEIIWQFSSDQIASNQN